MSTKPLAVVTGASTGIGRSLALELAERGYDLVVTADEATLAVVGGEVRAIGAEVTEVVLDLSTADGVEDLVVAVRATGRPVDALLVNAGIGVGGAFVETELEDHLRLIGLNVTGAVQLAHRLLPAMVERGAGRVLFTSSIAATLPGPYQSTYNASKAFVQLFSQGLRAELAEHGVSVTALMPGPTETAFFARADMGDTALAQMSKDDPSDVARDAIDAMEAGKDHVVAGSLKNKLQSVASTLLPAPVAAAISRVVTTPGSGE
jgi:short-subunit dehydrogenase